MIVNYTTLEQSKKLIELGLDIETSDMSYIETPINEFRLLAYSYKEVIVLRDARCSDATVYPAWSLGALLRIMPKCIVVNGNTYLSYITGLDTVSYVGIKEENIITFNYDILFDSVFAIITWLLENNHIKKGN